VIVSDLILLILGMVCRHLSNTLLTRLCTCLSQGCNSHKWWHRCNLSYALRIVLYVSRQ
jgi:hypothetical protein